MRSLSIESFKMGFSILCDSYAWIGVFQDCLIHEKSRFTEPSFLIFYLLEERVLARSHS
jgi:hypothetical protein